MLVAVPQITSAFTHINALFIQPTTWCARNCNGCYVKGFANNNIKSHSNISLFKQIFYALNINHETLGRELTHPLYVNQVTLALDQMPVDRAVRQVMKDLFYNFLESKAHSIGGEFHATVHTVNDLLEYMKDSTNKLMPIHEWRIQLDMLSISHINIIDQLYLEQIRKFIAPAINWNLTVDPSVDMEKIKKSFSDIVEWVDSVYLVLHKPNTGHFFDEKTFLIHQDFLKFIKTLPQKVQDKVTIDGCLSDSRRFLSTGYGCSSNISRFQVWPDGSVTGCAYNQNRITPPATDITSFLKNIHEASKVYEFDKCKIPTHLDPKNTYVQQRINHHLEIIE